MKGETGTPGVPGQTRGCTLARLLTSVTEPAELQVTEKVACNSGFQSCHSNR